MPFRRKYKDAFRLIPGIICLMNLRDFYPERKKALANFKEFAVSACSYLHEGNYYVLTKNTFLASYTKTEFAKINMEQFNVITYKCFGEEER